ncbi:MAG: alpha/beta fold hydrolase, partial [Myxococcota bacterium]
MQPTSRRVPGAHGLFLHLLAWNPESSQGVPLLLVHGFGNEAHIWDDLAPDLVPYYRVLALDLRGHGDSDWDPKGRYDHEDHAADLEAVVDHLEATRCVLIGHSLGARACMLYAGRHSERVAGFVAVDSAPELDPRGTLRIQMDTAEKMDPNFESVHEYESALSLAYPAARPSAIKRMAQHGLKVREDGRFALKMDPALRGATAGRLDP